MDMKHFPLWSSGACKVHLPFRAQLAVEVTSKEKTNTCEESVVWTDLKNKFKVQRIKDFPYGQEISYSFHTGNLAKKPLSPSQVTYLET